MQTMASNHSVEMGSAMKEQLPSTSGTLMFPRIKSFKRYLIELDCSEHAKKTFKLWHGNFNCYRI